VSRTPLPEGGHRQWCGWEKENDPECPEATQWLMLSIRDRASVVQFPCAAEDCKNVAILGPALYTGVYRNRLGN
jgi:hypothetical protein